MPVAATGPLAPDEDVLAVAALAVGHLVATRIGLWVPGEDGPTRVAWHLVSHAAWDGTELSLLVAEEIGDVAGAVLLRDVVRRVYAVVDPGNLPAVVQARVTATIRGAHHQDLPGGGAWFVQRRVPGRDGVVLQARVDAGTDVELVRGIAEAVADRLPH